MNIIFLDVDGELTYSDYENSQTENIDIEKVKILKEICDKTNAKVVISSSWRGTDKYTPKCYYILLEILSNNKIDVIGNTPYIPTEFENESIPQSFFLDEFPKFKIKYGTGRAAEIKSYIDKHNIDKFVIFDDEDFGWSDYGLNKNWIQPTWYGNGGLKKEHIEEAIKILT